MPDHKASSTVPLWNDKFRGGKTTYDSYSEWKCWTEGDFGKPAQREIAFYQKELGTLLDKKGASKKKVLEIGFGNGPFLGWALSKNYQIYGSEVQSTLRTKAQKAGVGVVDGPSDLAPASLDAVAAFDVFEHIEYRSLLALCRDIFVALRPDGFLVARFPNGDSPFGMIYQNGDPTHLTALGQGRVSGLMKHSGFSKYELRAPSEIPSSIKGRIKLQTKNLLRAAYSSFVRSAFLGRDTPSTFTANYLLVAQKT